MANLKGVGFLGAGLVGAVLAGWAGTLLGADVDTAAAEALAKKSGCLTCHSIAQKKAAISYKAVAEKYKGKADAEDQAKVMSQGSASTVVFCNGLARPGMPSAEVWWTSKQAWEA